MFRRGRAGGDHGGRGRGGGGGGGGGAEAREGLGMGRGEAGANMTFQDSLLDTNNVNAESIQHNQNLAMHVDVYNTTECVRCNTITQSHTALMLKTLKSNL